jgi:hypothetical protein
MFNNSNIIIDLGDENEDHLTNVENNDKDKEDNIAFAFEKQRQTLALKPRKPMGSIIVIDNFYNYALDVRKYILTQEFSLKGDYPGQRTISYATEDLKNIIQKYVEPFGGKIIDFPIPKADSSDASGIYNGAFQYTVASDRSRIHVDNGNNWAGIIFLTPDAPLSSGTAFYRFYDGSTSKEDSNLLKNKEIIDRFTQDLTKWEKVDQIGNIFNRLILFDARNYHMSADYFGDTKENGRLFQVFFFSTEC